MSNANHCTTCGQKLPDVDLDDNAAIDDAMKRSIRVNNTIWNSAYDALDSWQVDPGDTVNVPGLGDITLLSKHERDDYDSEAEIVFLILANGKVYKKSGYSDSYASSTEWHSGLSEAFKKTKTVTYWE